MSCVLDCDRKKKTGLRAPQTGAMRKADDGPALRQRHPTTTTAGRTATEESTIHDAGREAAAGVPLHPSWERRPTNAVEVSWLFGLPEWPTVHLLLLFLGVATRFYRLEEPRGVVFDEYHFGAYRVGG